LSEEARDFRKENDEDIEYVSPVDLDVRDTIIIVELDVK